eukprot:gb/GECG01003131.1/.p1 GENE.gb/GECG01003131.1/~~gb/GECG01003131.1/.p1  ORF type:complete len:554 (+),score=76.39 gb/GECG01003131.1/:1-1662(+)
MPPKRRVGKRAAEAPNEPQNSSVGKRNRRVSSSYFNTSEADKSEYIDHIGDNMNSKLRRVTKRARPAKQDSTEGKNFPTWEGVCSGYEPTHSPSSSPPSLRAYKRKRTCNASRSGCFAGSKKAATTKQQATATPESPTSSSNALDPKKSRTLNPHARNKYDHGITTSKRRAARKGYTKSSGRKNKSLCSEQNQTQKDVTSDWTEFAFTVHGQKFYIGDDISVSSPGESLPFIAKVMGAKSLKKGQEVNVYWYYRKSELGCRKCIGSRELCLAPDAQDSIPIESINHKENVWSIGTDCDSIADVPLDAYFRRFDYDLKSKKILFPEGYRPTDIQGVWERSLKRWKNSGASVEEAIDMFKKMKKETPRPPTGNARNKAASGVCNSSPRNTVQVPKRATGCASREARTEAATSDTAKKSNRVGKRRSLEKSKSTKGAEEHEKNLKHTAECQRDYALQEDIVVASENHEETIVRIVNFYSTDRKLLLVSPYRSPRQCGNHRWMGTRELFFAPSTTYVVPTTAVRRKASVWSLVSELPSSEDARCHEFTFHYTYFGTE